MKSSVGRQRAAFIDRDGVINRDHGYVSRWENFELLPGVVDALTLLQDLGFELVVVTNQSGIGRGYYDEAAFKELTARMVEHFSHEGVTIAGVYFCPHHPSDAKPAYRQHCDCRKPEPGMLLQAAADLDLDLGHSIMIGDKVSDMRAGHAAGVARCYRVADHAAVEAEDPVVPSLWAAAQAEQQFQNS